MDNGGRRCLGGERKNNSLPAQAFIEAIGAMTATISQASVMATTIAQASATVGQGGPSNLQRFKAHHPPTFKGEGEPIEADHWFRQVGKILEAMEITSNATTKS